MTEIMPVPRILILLSYQQGAFAVRFFTFMPELKDVFGAGNREKFS